MMYTLLVVYLLGSYAFGRMAYHWDGEFDLGVVVIALFWPILIVGVACFALLTRILKPRIK